MGFASWGMLFGFPLLVLTLPFSVSGETDARDVMAINDLYVSLGSPSLPGWVSFGGDPCGEGWLGVYCVFSNITEIRLSGMNLGGNLSDSLGDFASILTVDLSNNHIAGSIPDNLPPTVRIFLLSGNQLNGTIPSSLSLLSQSSDLALNNNHLSGEIPDSFQPLTGLINLDMSDNNLTGRLPPSMGSLSSLKTLNLQNNKLTGILDVIQDLFLTELNIENNLFSGPIPANLYNIPDFRKDGNPFNTTVIPTPSAPRALPPSPAWPPSSKEEHRKQANGPSDSKRPVSARASKFWKSDTVILIVIIGAIVLLTAGVCFSLWRCCRGRQLAKHSEKHHMDAYEGAGQGPNYSKSSLPSMCKMEKVPHEPVLKPLGGYEVDSRRTGSIRNPEQVIDVSLMAASSKHKDHEIHKKRVDANVNQLLQPPQPPPLFLRAENAAKSPAMTEEAASISSSKTTSSSVSVFTIALLQQYTDSFSEENFIGEGLIGSVYRAELPDGKLLAIKKLHATTSAQLSDDEFLDLVSSISRLKHANIVELVGYCNECGQRLLVYEYYGNGTLYDALHIDEEIHKSFSWSARVRVAVGAARALQYLHEVCQPPIVHQNFKSANILLDEKFAACVSDCGLAPLLSSCSTSEWSGYAAIELESGNYTCQSDVYSLGVVMLELLTGRKSYDRTRPRAEQSLARWAIPQLHDIDALSRMVDPAVNGAYPIKSLSRFADIISRCVQLEPGFRPPASEVVQDLVHML